MNLCDLYTTWRIYHLYDLLGHKLHSKNAFLNSYVFVMIWSVEKAFLFTSLRVCTTFPLNH
ncbi:unnamed protein product, partial [Callosobruchus maculatus]